MLRVVCSLLFTPKVREYVAKLRQDFDAGKSTQAASSLASFLLLGHKDALCSFAALPFDIITEMAHKVFLISPPVIVFGTNELPHIYSINN
jgi:hypothetical protein